MAPDTSLVERRRHIRLATGLAFGGVVGVAVGLGLRVDQLGRYTRGVLGEVMLVGFVLVAGGIVVSQVVDTLTHKLQGRGRTIGFGVLVVAVLAAWAWAFAGTSWARTMRCEAKRTKPEALEAFLGASPDAVDIFIPSYPSVTAPSEDERKGLGIRTHYGSADLNYTLDGVRVYVSPLGYAEAEAEVWSVPRVALDGLGRVDIEAWWGPASEVDGRVLWSAGGVEAELIEDSHECGRDQFLEFRRHRPWTALLGPSADQPIAGVDGPLVGKTLSELGLTPTWVFGSQHGGMQAEVILVDREGPGTRLELNTTEDERVVGWRLELAGPSRRDAPRTRGTLWALGGGPALAWMVEEGPALHIQGPATATVDGPGRAHLASRRPTGLLVSLDRPRRQGRAEARRASRPLAGRKNHLAWRTSPVEKMPQGVGPLARRVAPATLRRSMLIVIFQ